MALDRLLSHPREPQRLADLAGRSLNVDPCCLDEYGAAEDWHRDYRQPLPSGPPGDPVPGGSFETAERLMPDYRFAEGSAIEAVFERGGALEGDMLLRARGSSGCRSTSGCVWSASSGSPPSRTARGSAPDHVDRRRRLRPAPAAEGSTATCARRWPRSSRAR